MTNSLYSEIKGAGQNVVLLHGWGMHGGLWGKFNDLISNHCQTHAIDLPGFGYSKKIKNDFTLDALSEAVEKYISNIRQPVILIGWSLGGLISLNILKRKNVVIDKVVFVATTPSFTKKPGWDCAMEQSVFDGFSNDLKTDYKKTLKRFLFLQARGSDLSRDDLRELYSRLNSHGKPDLKALEKGLDILSNADLRSEKQSETPVMLVVGKKDTLVPLSVTNEFENMFSSCEKLILEKTGHAPFISNPEVCAEKIMNFINE